MIRELKAQIDDMENEEMKLLLVKHDLGMILCEEFAISHCRCIEKSYNCILPNLMLFMKFNR